MVNSKRSFSAMLFSLLKIAKPLLALSALVVCVEAAGQVAIVHPNGSVKINGAAVNRSVPVFEGDRIATAEGATALIEAGGNRVSLFSKSAIVYGKQQIEVIENGVLVSTRNGMGARFGDTTVLPATVSATEFELRNDANGTVVNATSGSVSIEAEGRSTALDEGKSWMHGNGSNPGGVADNHGWGWGGGGGSDDKHKCKDGNGGGHAWDSFGQYFYGEGERGGGGGDHDNCCDHGDKRGDCCDHNDCRCEHDDCRCKPEHHGHPESPIKPCRGDRYDDHCRCEEHRGW